MDNLNLGIANGITLGVALGVGVSLARSPAEEPRRRRIYRFQDNGSLAWCDHVHAPE